MPPTINLPGLDLTQGGPTGLGGVPDGHQVNYSMTITKEETEDEANHRRRREWWTLVYSLCLVGVVVALCVHIALNPSAGKEDRQWGLALIGVLVGNFSGYILKTQK